MIITFNCTTVVLVHIAGIIAHYWELLGAVWLCFIFFEYSASGYYGHYCPLPGSTQSLCQLTCQSADIMSSLCGVGVRVRVRVRVNNFSSKTTRPRDVLFFLKDTLSIEDEKLFKACKSVCSSVC